MVEQLIGKKVFIFDTETTGLPEKKPGGKFGTRSEYYSPNTRPSAYDTARIVSIAWFYTDNFTYSTLDTNNINHYIRKPEGFTEIPKTHIHGISYDNAMTNGILFKEILKTTPLEADLLNCDYIVAHNVLFDIHILLNELVRSEEFNLTEKINAMLDYNKCICTGEIGKPICKLGYKNSKIDYVNYTSGNSNSNTTTATHRLPRYKMPKLCEFYNHLFGCEMQNAHSASGDVKALMEILRLIVRDIDDDENSNGDVIVDKLSKI
uniref:Exonuclease domain-containing protein n=1 Tax=viral metagenome TaxID=1070528 RepID=A0A6C0HLK0_9ZZZZ